LENLPVINSYERLTNYRATVATTDHRFAVRDKSDEFMHAIMPGYTSLSIDKC